MKQAKLYQKITDQYDVNKEIRNWYDEFDGLEKEDVWRKLPAEERAFATQLAKDRVAGLVDEVAVQRKMGPFDDMTDAENMNFIA